MSYSLVMIIVIFNVCSRNTSWMYIYINPFYAHIYSEFISIYIWTFHFIHTILHTVILWINISNTSNWQSILFQIIWFQRVKTMDLRGRRVGVTRLCSRHRHSEHGHHPPHLYTLKIKIEANSHLFLVRVFICVTFYW